MGTRYTRFAQFRKALFENTTPATWIALLLIIALIAGAVFWWVTRPLPDPLDDPAFDIVRQRGAIRVGVRTDISAFALRTLKEGDQEEWSGFEVDLARELAKAIFDDPTAVDFVPLDFTTRHIRLRAGDVDLVVALCPQGYSSSFIYSEPYYTDAVVAIVLNDGPQSLIGLQNGKVGAIARPSGISGSSLANQGALTVLQEYNNNAQAAIDIHTFSAAPDLFSALREGKVLSIVMENALLSRYFNEEDMRPLPTALGLLNYSAVAMPGNKAYIDFATRVFSEMRADGRMNALYQKYQLVSYTYE